MPKMFLARPSKNKFAPIIPAVVTLLGFFMPPHGQNPVSGVRASASVATRPIHCLRAQVLLLVWHNLWILRSQRQTSSHVAKAGFRTPSHTPGVREAASSLSGFLARKSPTGWPAAVALALARRARYFARMKISPAHLEILGVADSPTEREGLPLYLSPVEAGFPSPADDFLDRRLDLHKFLVRNESATFFLRAHGESMINAGIHDGDLLVVDRSESAGHNRIVIAAVDGELTVKRLIRRRNRVLLAPENPDYPEIDITEHEYVHIWGVVTYVVHKL